MLSKQQSLPEVSLSVRMDEYAIHHAAPSLRPDRIIKTVESLSKNPDYIDGEWSLTAISIKLVSNFEG